MQAVVLAGFSMLFAMLFSAAADSADIDNSSSTQLVSAQFVSVETTFQDGTYRLHWETATPKKAVRILVSADPTAVPSAMRVLDEANKRGEAIFHSPLGPNVRPYFYIQSDNAQGLRTTTRVVPMEGASNFRDFGGYPTVDGRFVKWGQIFRSNKLSKLTNSDYETIKKLNIRLVCDLRTEGEREEQPTVWKGKAVEFVSSPKIALDADLEHLMYGRSSSVEEARIGIINFYKSMPTFYAAELRIIFRKLLNEQAPLLLHCSAGKDRSGFISAMILSALGVPRDKVAADYALSADLIAHEEMGEDDHEPSDIEKITLASDPAYILAALDTIDHHYGTLNTYLEKELSISSNELIRLRKLYLE